MSEGATVRRIGSSKLRATSQETAGAYLKAADRAAELHDKVAERNNEHRAENQPKGHDLNYGRPRENAATAT
jgi:hypothetical protein